MKYDSTINICCTICANQIVDYLPKYFCGSTISPVCKNCKKEANLAIGNESDDPFTSFSAEGMPSTLVSHWTLFTFSSQSHSFIPSLKHYVLLPNPGER